MTISHPSRTCRTALAAAAVLVLTVYAGAVAAAEGTPATVRVSSATGLTEGQSITVTGQGFHPGLTAVAVGLCKKGYTSNKDCDLGGGARLVTIGPDGVLPTVTLSVRSQVAGADCRTTACVVGVAPLPSGTPTRLVAANSVRIPVGFAGGSVAGEASGTGTAAPAVAPAPRADGWEGPSDLMWSASSALTVLCLVLAFVRRRRGAAPGPTAPTTSKGSA
ncbi:neocarzinostatin apoprotein domain-containing protein [Streptomyces sp. NPDC058623]|uniref:neocarzinostatin apoprotein domain-containing protein n=1 Tax=Streptomyces sp. NPDC058623 TaxID=3346563 RepID=UPI0036490C99